LEQVIMTKALGAVEIAIAKAIKQPGSMLALYGPCGVGKTVAVRTALENIGSGVDVIQVEIPEKERLCVSAIMDTILESLGETPKRFAQAKTVQLQRALGERSKSRRVVLVIDEAHALPIRTLKGLKRLLELGYALRSGLFSVVLVGQSEMKERLRAAPEVGKRARRYEMGVLTDKEREMIVGQVAEAEGLKLKDEAGAEIARRAVLPLDLVQIVSELSEWAQERGITTLDLGTVMHALGETRRRLMAEYGISVSDIARVAGVSKATVSDSLNGAYAGKRETAAAVENAFSQIVQARQAKRESGDSPQERQERGTVPVFAEAERR
jgi:hypothetical protein